MAFSEEGVGHAAAKGTLLGFLLRILSFTLTQITVRFVDPKTLGRASIRLELLLNTALFLGREGFRLALTKKRVISTSLKSGKKKKTDNDDNEEEEEEVDEESLRKVNNVAWLSIPMGLIPSLICLAVHLLSCESMMTEGQDNHSKYEDNVFDQQSNKDYKLAGMLYCYASMIECLGEPLVIECMRSMDVTTRARAEGYATMSKALINVILLSPSMSMIMMMMMMEGLSIRDHWPVTAFGMSQLVYSMVLTGYLYYSKWGVIHWPSIVDHGEESATATATIDNPYRHDNHNTKSIMMRTRQSFDQPTIRLVLIFFFQSIFKHVLTEGDRIVLTALSGSYDQGVYAMASTYGGMVSRLLFMPLEENARLLFSRQHAHIEQAKEQQHHDMHQTQQNNNHHPKQNDALLLQDILSSYTTLLKLVLYIGLLFASLASNYTSILLNLLAGRTWGSNIQASAALSAFCVYTALLALNGTTEAFVYGVAQSDSDVGRLVLAHALVGAIFYGIAPLFVRYAAAVSGHGMFMGGGGAVGLVAANACTMGLRSLYSLFFAARYFRTSEISSSVSNDKGTTTTTTKSRKRWLWILMRRMSPHPIILVSFVISYIITGYSRLQLQLFEETTILLSGNGGVSLISSKEWIKAAGRHIAVGISCALFIVIFMYKLEREFGSSLTSMVSRRRRQKLD